MNSRPTPRSASPASNSVVLLVSDEAAAAMADSRTEPAKPYSRAMPNRNSAEE